MALLGLEPWGEAPAERPLPRGPQPHAGAGSPVGVMTPMTMKALQRVHS